ncbi:hypothetical protein Asppvi_005614 [Aspergillus pseudoviridinutans]|uniref:Uncharacterized protein n=1 Tax=Aspergillus pseudoviridinutans TaxID=1517512 RepID=A0A9P3BFD7_9EURO|nr:uncharacterized protein Asppvi_005614 [Aspergillus pseudoviridinutans]GIJ86721.1 hypothetical protein Asppvi_005614 [Aspergillus pseudoviridinutans]
MLIIAGAVGKHVVCVYGNLACLVSGYKAYITRISRPKSAAFCPTCSRKSNYHITDEDQETGVAVLASPELIDAESESLVDGGSTSFRASEDTAVSLGRLPLVTVECLYRETFDGHSAGGQTK